MKSVIYVDSLYGSNSNAGDIDTPVQTLSYAYSIAYEGATIVLQTGAGTTYGALTIDKKITIQAAYGTTPKVDKFTLTNAQGLFEGLTFDKTTTPTLTEGIVVNNSAVGSVIIRDCRFHTVDNPITINNAQYISIPRNSFYRHAQGIRINTAQEVCVSSNVFSQGSQSIEVITVDRLDVWGNTIYGAAGSASPITPDENLRIIYKTLTSFDINYKRIQLPTAAYPLDTGQYGVAVNVLNDASSEYGVDYTVDSLGFIVRWDGLGLEGILQVGDILRIMYNEGLDPGGGEAVRVMNVGDPNSRFDSNNVTRALVGSDIDIGVFFTSPIKIRHSNFYGDTKWWYGAVPTGDTGLNNINDNPLYRDPPVGYTGDFGLQYQGVSGTSPDIDAGDPGRWSDTFSEMGVIKIGDRYTGSGPRTRENVAPFDRSLDYLYYNRGVTGMVGVTGDIGAYEFNQHETALGNYVAEQGYDIAHPGTETGPYATLDRGYARAGTLDLYVHTNPIAMEVGDVGYTGPVSGPGYGRYYSKDMVLSASDLRVGTSTVSDVAYVYPSYPSFETGVVYVGMDPGTGVTGTSGNPYLTITDALSTGSPYIMVRPGFYPSFRGETGVHLVGVEERRTVLFGSELYSSPNLGSWTGLQNNITGMANELLLTNYVNTYSQFGFEPPIDFRFTVGVTGVPGTFYGGITDTDNCVYMGVDYSNRNFIIGYRTTPVGETGKQTYEVYGYFTGSSSDIRSRITLTDDRFSVNIRNDLVNDTYSHTLGSNYTGIWNVFLWQDIMNTSTVSSIQLQAASFTGVVGVTGTMTQRKVFGILGVTGAYR